MTDQTTIPANARALTTMAVLAAVALAMGGCADLVDSDGAETSGQGAPHETVQQAIAAYCSIGVQGSGTVQMETDYLPNVVACENGAADYAALQAQAVAARSYAYYRLDTGDGTVADGTSDQVYSCGITPRQEIFDAVASTSGIVLRYSNVNIAGFFVAGAIPSDRTGCVAVPGDNDYSNTERYVTYNEGRSGSGLEQTTLGWVNPGNNQNRGCMGQNATHCLAEAGHDWRYMMRFHYGEDIEIHQTTGACVVDACACEAGSTDTRACGSCGTQTRSCNTDCQGWSDWSACAGEGVCAPGTEESQDCCDCGTQARTCTDSCEWNEWAGCADAGTGGGDVCEATDPTACGPGVTVCGANGCLMCVSDGGVVGVETCDGVDNNCNGLVDEDEPVELGNPPPPFAADIVELTHATEVTPGDTFDVELQIQNVGSRTWQPEEIVLVAGDSTTSQPSPFGGPDWIDGSTIGRSDATVAPGETLTLAFTARMPATADGTESDRLRLVANNNGPIACPTPSALLTVNVPGAVGADTGNGTDTGNEADTGIESDTSDGLVQVRQTCSATPTHRTPAGILAVFVALIGLRRRRR